MLKLGLVVAAAFVLQIVLSSIQMRHFAKEFTAMRRRGRVACGRQAGGFHAGAIVLFLLDGAGVIQEGKMLMGVTCFARVRPLPGFTGKPTCPGTGKTCAVPFWTHGIPITNLSPVKRFPSRHPPSVGSAAHSPATGNKKKGEYLWSSLSIWRPAL